MTAHKPLQKKSPITASLTIELCNPCQASSLAHCTLVATMFPSDMVNNAAAVVLMAHIGICKAHGLDLSADPFLMAIGASCTLS